ncbi:type II toxin-antitoxin system YafO family toxin [Escherichia coli]|nr:type II toxin-antitoxin system YafO family toxin [Escherichia coli]
MPVKVSVHQDVEYRNVAMRYACMLEEWMNQDILPSHFGHHGRWECNHQCNASGIYKLHIRLPHEPGWSPGQRQAERKSDSYLVYARHWCDNRAQIISIMHPKAHEKSKSTFLAILIQRAEDFQSS